MARTQGLAERANLKDVHGKIVVEMNSTQFMAWVQLLDETPIRKLVENTELAKSEAQLRTPSRSPPLTQTALLPACLAISLAKTPIYRFYLRPFGGSTGNLKTVRFRDTFQSGTVRPLGKGDAHCRFRRAVFYFAVLPAFRPACSAALPCCSTSRWMRSCTDSVGPLLKFCSAPRFMATGRSGTEASKPCSQVRGSNFF